MQRFVDAWSHNGWAAFVLAAVCVVGVPKQAGAQVGSPGGPVPVNLLQARRDALARKLGKGVAVIFSSEERPEADYPQDSDYRENDNFFYLTGLEAKSSLLVIVAQPNQPARAVLYLPARNRGEEVWTGPQLGPGAEASKITGIADVRPLDRSEADIGALLNDSTGKRAFLENPNPLSARCRGESERCNEQVIGAVVLEKTVKPVPLAGIIGELRLIKDADELRRMRRAIDITNEAERALLSAARPGMWEYELEALVEYTFRRRGAERVGFPTIIGSGINATTLHYDKGRRQTTTGDLVVADIGAEFGYYTADVTRTFPVSGRFTDRQRAIYNLVLATQQTAIDSIRPGMDIGKLNRIARAYMKDHSGKLCGDETCDNYFPHGLSHWLGMDTHDAGDYARKFEPGMVLTVEPGIYLPDEALGVRIEDDVLVTPTGHEVLSQSAPREAAAIEKAMAEASHAAAGSGAAHP